MSQPLLDLLQLHALRDEEYNWKAFLFFKESPETQNVPRGCSYFACLLARVISKLAFKRNCTTSSGASGKSTEIQCSLFM